MFGSILRFLWNLVSGSYILAMINRVRWSYKTWKRPLRKFVEPFSIDKLDDPYGLSFLIREQDYFEYPSEVSDRLCNLDLYFIRVLIFLWQKEPETISLVAVNSSSEWLNLQLNWNPLKSVIVTKMRICLLRDRSGSKCPVTYEYQYCQKCDQPTDTYTIGGLRIQVTRPLYQWHIKFKGFCRIIMDDEDDSTNVDQEFIKLSLFVNTLSKFNEPSLLPSSVWSRIFSRLDSKMSKKEVPQFYQTNVYIRGLVTLGDDESEFYLWGVRGKYFKPQGINRAQCTHVLCCYSKVKARSNHVIFLKRSYLNFFAARNKFNN